MANKPTGKVQIQVRLTAKEREQIKDLANHHQQSMNQYILDKALEINHEHASTEDNKNYEGASTFIAYLKTQVAEKDQQISALNMRLEESYKLIDQQQQLSLLQQQPLKITEDDKERNEENDKHSKRWWQRIWS